jgi:hypothetical protein
VIAFLEQYTNSEHFLLLNNEHTVEEATKYFYQEFLAPASIAYEELNLLDATLLMPELVGVLLLND